MNSKEYSVETKKNERGISSYNNNSSEEKIRMVKETLRKEAPLNGNGFKKGIDTELFNKCTRDFIEIQNGSFVHNVRSEVTSFEVNHLKNQNNLLKQLIAELSHENILLKNKLLGHSNNQNSQA